ncbi:hypothetical protein LTR15_000706 [Elasticomyces elasticus]|nr:hypothetical protein LTR15_000706 [Elasticomyces elasticus]
MQTLWSRVAQARGTCHCPQCVQPVQAVGRRATASATQRIPRYLTSSTLFYSGIFAAAATWDAGAKIQRREQWDKAIADVKQELGQAAEAVQVSRKQQGPDETVQYMPDLFRDVDQYRRRSLWPTNTGPELKVHRLPPESIYATGERKTRSEMRRWSPKKLETVMLSVDAMQLKIFVEMQRQKDQSWRQVASTAVPVEYRDKMFLSVPELQASLQCKLDDLQRVVAVDPGLSEWARSPNDVPLCAYRQDEQGTFHDTVRQLNGSLQDLFHDCKYAPESTPSLLAKVAYNLSISSAPPNIDTYNTLLLGLSQTKQHRMAQQVITSMRATHMRPNEVTNTAVLNHFTVTDNAEGFVHWVELMRGKHNGLALARRDIHINEAGKNRLIRVKREGKGDKVIQLPYPTPNVFGALIRGVLKFSGFETALGICDGMGQEGWGLCLSGLTPLLMHCADNGDWEPGLAIWGQIQALKLRSLQRYTHHKRDVDTVPLEAFAAMVRLCSKAGHKDVFEDVWDQAMRADKQNARTLVQLVKAQNEAALRAPVDTPDSREEAEPVNQAITSDVAELPVEALVDEPSNFRHDEMLDSELPVLNASKGNPSRSHQTPRDKPEMQLGAALYRPTQRRTPSVLLREQLDGSLPAGHELEDYELRERPMTMYG